MCLNHRYSESPVLCILLAENKSFAFYGVNQLRDGVLVLLHHVGQLLLGHRSMIPQQVDEHELFRGKWHLGLAELCCYELLEPEACMVKVYGDFFRK
jgi:hypothetical protein